MNKIKIARTRAIGVRLQEEDLDLIYKRAYRKGCTFNQWINWAVKNGLRSHRRK